MKIYSICLVLIVSLSFKNCRSIDFFQINPQNTKELIANCFAGKSLMDFNKRFYDESSIYKGFLNIRRESESARVDKVEILVLKFNTEFRNKAERIFPGAELSPFTIEMKVLSGQTSGHPGPTGFEVAYASERIRVGQGASLDAAWNQFQKSGFTQRTVQRRERWEAIKDGLWLAEENEELSMGSMKWRHKPGSLDFFHPITEFKSNNNLTASLYYDYNLNRYDKLSIDKYPDPENLVFKDENSSLHFVDGQLDISYNRE